MSIKTIQICVLLTLSGCSMMPDVVYRDVARPILVCPAPPKIKLPVLYSTMLTDADSENYGKVAQYYNITIRQLLDHIKKHELILQRYNKTSESYIEMNAEFELMYKHQRIEDEIDRD